MFILNYRPIAALLALASLALVARLDHVTGVEISFSIFYLLPVSIVAWYVGLWEGLFMCVICAAVWYIMDSIMGQHAYNNPVAPYWNAVVRFGLFFVTTVTLSMLQKALSGVHSVSKQRATILHLVMNCLDSMDHEFAALQEKSKDEDFHQRAHAAIERNRILLRQMSKSMLNAAGEGG